MKEGETVSEHTKEPWSIIEVENDAPRIVNAEIKQGVGVIFALTNAKRIVLCVNACAGKTDAELEGFAGKLFMGSQIALWSSYCELKERNAALEQQLAASEQQRGELVELVRIINTHEDSYDDAENVLGKIFYLCNQARQKNEALAKSQGVQS